MFTRQLADYIGDISQVGGVKRYVLNSGKAKGVEAVDVNNGSGLVYTVVPDRGMDIYHLNYKGIPVSFISKTGIVSPCFYNDRGFEWLRSFTGGFLTTCGLTQVGDPCIYNGNEYGLHGNCSNIPADNVSVLADWIDDSYVMRISGHVRQTKVLFENLTLKRTIETRFGVDEISMEDVIVNEGDRKEPFMILYHMNFGYPFLNPETDLIIPSRKVYGWDELSDKNIDKHLKISEPDSNSPELTWYHDMHCDQDGMAGFMVTNSKQNPDIGIVVRYNGNILDNLVQWRYLHKKDYVMALEPCNNKVKGVEYESKQGNLKFIEPGESIKILLDFKFLSSYTEIENEKRNMHHKL